MKDYLLSEIEKICEKQKGNFGSCKKCEVRDFCLSGFKVINMKLDIEPRDMIELPCKIPVRIDDDIRWQVVYRGLTRSGIIITTQLFTEPEAKAYLEDVRRFERKNNYGGHKV